MSDTKKLGRPRSYTRIRCLELLRKGHAARDIAAWKGVVLRDLIRWASEENPPIVIPDDGGPYFRDLKLALNKYPNQPRSAFSPPSGAFRRARSQ